VKCCYVCMLPLALLSFGCGRAERKEAVTFGQLLAREMAAYASTNDLEKDAFMSTRAWCEGITQNGSGKGAALKENADSATSLANFLSLVSNQLGQIRQAIRDLPLHQEKIQDLRGKLTSQILQHQKMLQGVRATLEGAAQNFLDSANSRAYTGDTYPAGIDRLSSVLGSYTRPEDLLGKTMEQLKSAYKLQPAELAASTPAT
jgi:hypothetical protein